MHHLARYNFKITKWLWTANSIVLWLEWRWLRPCNETNRYRQESVHHQQTGTKQPYIKADGFQNDSFMSLSNFKWWWTCLNKRQRQAVKRRLVQSCSEMVGRLHWKNTPDKPFQVFHQLSGYCLNLEFHLWFQQMFALLRWFQRQSICQRREIHSILSRPHKLCLKSCRS